MFVTVIHGETNRSTFEVENHKPVASFSFPVATVEEALDLGYFHTQNLFDSWSLDGSRDSHHSMELHKPRPIYEGEELGHRSSMVGDFIDVWDGVGSQRENFLGTYRIEDFGFKKVD